MVVLFDFHGPHEQHESKIRTFSSGKPATCPSRIHTLCNKLGTQGAAPLPSAYTSHAFCSIEPVHTWFDFGALAKFLTVLSCEDMHLCAPCRDAVRLHVKFLKIVHKYCVSQLVTCRQ